VPVNADTVEVDIQGVINSQDFGVKDGDPFTAAAFHTAPDSPIGVWPCVSGICAAAYAVPDTFTFSVDGSTVSSSNFAPPNNDIYVAAGPVESSLSWIFSSNLVINGPLSIARSNLLELFLINFARPSSILDSPQIPEDFPALNE
jgi:hypothetical protein